MPIQDAFVGGVAAILGIAIILGAAGRRTWLLERRGARSLVAALGQSAARVVLGLIGIALVMLGILIALGWRHHWF